MSALNFDANTVQPQGDFTALPAGDYLCMIIDSELKPTKSGSGQYLELTMKIIDGPMAERQLWDRLTLSHDNAKTVEIAQRKLSAICHAVGVLQVTDSAQLHGIPLKVRVQYKEDPQYGPKNEIGGYKPANATSNEPVRTAPAASSAPAWRSGQAAQPATPVQQQAATTPPPSKPAATTPPWARA